jgi:tRNA G46 methylase TrmB
MINSRQVHSTQIGIHPRLEALLARRNSSEWSQPFHRPSVQAFKALERVVEGWQGKIVLDSGCGTGESTRLIARAMPDCLVVGIDKSLSRLSRTGAKSFPHRTGNAVWVRAAGRLAPAPPLHPVPEPLAQARGSAAPLACPPGIS